LDKIIAEVNAEHGLTGVHHSQAVAAEVL